MKEEWREKFKRGGEREKLAKKDTSTRTLSTSVVLRRGACWEALQRTERPLVIPLTRVQRL